MGTKRFNLRVQHFHQHNFAVYLRCSSEGVKHQISLYLVTRCLSGSGRRRKDFPDGAVAHRPAPITARLALGPASPGGVSGVSDRRSRPARSAQPTLLLRLKCRTQASFCGAQTSFYSFLLHSRRLLPERSGGTLGPGWRRAGTLRPGAKCLPGSSELGPGRCAARSNG